MKLGRPKIDRVTERKVRRLLAKGGGSGLATLGIPGSPGVTDGAAKDTVTARYNDEDAVAALFAEHGDAIAAVIVEPVAANMGVVPPADGFLEFLRDATREAGALLVFDEVITGFRVAYGGAQSLTQRGGQFSLVTPRWHRQADGCPDPGVICVKE